MYGGIETMLVTLARQRELCPSMQPGFSLCFEGRLAEELRTAGAAVHALGEVRASRPWTVWRARSRLRGILENDPYEVVVAHGTWTHAVFAPAVRAAGRRLVFWAHGPCDGRHWLERWARRAPPDLVIANSEFTKKSMPLLFPRVPAQVIYCPVAAPEEMPGEDREKARRELRAAMGVSDGTVVILQASRLESLKGHAVLLKALGRLRDLSDWSCWIVGGAQRSEEAAYMEGLQEEALIRKVETRVRFLGQRTDVPRLLAAADIYCQPNTGPESFGISFVEALYAGLPIVTTALGGALEIVDEACGILVPPGQPEQLAKQLQVLVQDTTRRSRLSNNAPARARQISDPASILKQLFTVLSAASTFA